MSTSTHRSISAAIVPSGRTSHFYGVSMLNGVTPAQFARHAPGPDGKRVVSNHPAWVYGHLACYNARIMELVERPEDARKLALPSFMELFKNGTECKDDAAGTIYPGMDEIVQAWQKGHEHVLAVLPEVGNEVFEKPNPAEGRFKEMFPTVGSAVAFLISGHPMSHIGQVSAWRRMFGLPSAM